MLDCRSQTRYNYADKRILCNTEVAPGPEARRQWGKTGGTCKAPNRVLCTSSPALSRNCDLGPAEKARRPASVMLLRNPSREKGWEMGHHILNPLSKRQGVSAIPEKTEPSEQPKVGRVQFASPASGRVRR